MNEPTSTSASAPRGFRVLTANLGVKDSTTDFCLVVSERPCVSAGVYTQSRFSGPSVALARAATGRGDARGVVVVSKNANVANGPDGDADAAAAALRVFLADPSAGAKILRRILP